MTTTFTTTGTTLVATARRILNDNGSPSRWSDEVLLTYVKITQDHFLRERPDFRLKADGALREVATLSVAGDVAYGIPDSFAWEAGLMIASMALMEDNADEANMQRASMYRNLARTQLEGRP